MNCNLTNGYAVPGCRDEVAGINKVYISNYSSDLIYGLSGSSVINITGATPSFYKFEQEVEAGMFNSEVTFSDTINNNLFYTNTLDLTFNKMSAENLDRAKLLAAARLTVIVEDNNGHYFLMNMYKPVKASKLTLGVGQKMGDLNGASMTFTVNEKNGFTPISYSAFSSFIQA